MSHTCRKLLPALALVTLFAASRAVALPPPEAQVQGLYEGVVKDGPDETRLEARVVAQGNGTYKVLIRQMLKDDKIAHVELAGKTAGDAVTISDGRPCGWTARYAAGSFQGTFGPAGTAWQLKRVEKKPPTLGKKPPEGAIALLEGKNLPEMVRANGADWHLGDMSQQGCTVWETPLQIISATEPKAWPSPDQLLPQGWALGKERRRADVVTGIAEDGSLQVPKGGMNSKRSFQGNFDLHVEFFLPLMPAAHGQGRANSGVYLPNGQEIQVLDSFGETTYTGGGCGGMYAYKDPDTMDVIESLKGKPECKYTLASLPPLEWQTYDVEYRVDKKDGKYAGKPHVTVYHNGIKIHDKFAPRQDAIKSHLHFQDHGNPVRFRNIWVLPVEQE
jgi:hypothetical protein